MNAHDLLCHFSKLIVADPSAFVDRLNSDEKARSAFEALRAVRAVRTQVVLRRCTSERVAGTDSGGNLLFLPNPCHSPQFKGGMVRVEH